MRILISGASGLVGTALLPYLKEKGQHPVRLIRRTSTPTVDAIVWDPEKHAYDSADFEGFDAVVNLSGENIASGRWTEEKKQRIIESRVKTTKALCGCLSKLKNPPKVLVNASAVGYYGDRGDEVLTEESSSGTNFLAKVCRQWEDAAEQAHETGIRLVKLRFGVVLTPAGGALGKMLLPFKLYLGGVLGSGQQYMSWITIDDLLRAILFAIERPQVQGAYNVVSPNPVTNETFTKTLGKVLRRPTVLPVPAFVIKLALGEMGEEMLLSSTRAIPQRLIAEGFAFKYPNLEEALRHLL